MEFGLFIKGLSIGFTIAAPVGPIGILCIRRSISEGRWIGLACGLGAAAADAIYGSIVAFGLTLLSDLIQSQQILFQGLGGLFLGYLGLQTFRSEPATTAASVNRGGYAGSFLSTLFLTLTNPMTMTLFLGIFVSAGIGIQSPDSLHALLMVIGVFLGSAAWWWFLSWGASSLKDRLSQNWLRQLNRGSGILIAGFGVYQLFRLVATDGGIPSPASP